MMQQEVPVFDDMFEVWLEPWWHSPWVLAGISVIFCVFIMMLMVLWRRRKGRLLPVDPQIRALERLVQIRELIDNEEADYVQHAYVQMTYVVKEYIDASYDCTTQGRTEHELRAYLADRVLQQPELSGWLTFVEVMANNGVAAKFARDEVAKELLMKDYDQLSILVQSSPVQTRGE